jgi:hypothetical protein
VEAGLATQTEGYMQLRFTGVPVQHVPAIRAKLLALLADHVRTPGALDAARIDLCIQRQILQVRVPLVIPHTCMYVCLYSWIGGDQHRSGSLSHTLSHTHFGCMLPPTYLLCCVPLWPRETQHAATAETSPEHAYLHTLIGDAVYGPADGSGLAAAVGTVARLLQLRSREVDYWRILLTRCGSAHQRAHDSTR